MEQVLTELLVTFKTMFDEHCAFVTADWRDKFFRQLDRLLDPPEWFEHEAPPSIESFETLLTLIDRLRPTVPGLGLAFNGNLIASWSHSGSHATIECHPGNRFPWSASVFGYHANSRDVTIDDLEQSLVGKVIKDWTFEKLALDVTKFNLPLASVPVFILRRLREDEAVKAYVARTPLTELVEKLQKSLDIEIEASHQECAPFLFACAIFMKGESLSGLKNVDASNLKKLQRPSFILFDGLIELVFRLSRMNKTPRLGAYDKNTEMLYYKMAISWDDYLEVLNAEGFADDDEPGIVPVSPETVRTLGVAHSALEDVSAYDWTVGVYRT